MSKKMYQSDLINVSFQGRVEIDCASTSYLISTSLDKIDGEPIK